MPSKGTNVRCNAQQADAGSRRKKLLLQAPRSANASFLNISSDPRLLNASSSAAWSSLYITPSLVLPNNTQDYAFFQVLTPTVACKFRRSGLGLHAGSVGKGMSPSSTVRTKLTGRLLVINSCDLLSLRRPRSCSATRCSTSTAPRSGCTLTR